MKTLIATGLMFTLLTGGAFAQTPPQPPAPENDDAAAHLEHIPPPPHERMLGDYHRPSGPEKSARFRLQVGDIFLGLTCPDDEPMKACEEFAMELLDKAGAIARR